MQPTVALHRPLSEYRAFFREIAQIHRGAISAAASNLPILSHLYTYTHDDHAILWADANDQDLQLLAVAFEDERLSRRLKHTAALTHRDDDAEMFIAAAQAASQRANAIVHEALKLFPKPNQTGATLSRENALSLHAILNQAYVNNFNISPYVSAADQKLWERAPQVWSEYQTAFYEALPRQIVAMGDGSLVSDHRHPLGLDIWDQPELSYTNERAEFVANRAVDDRQEPVGPGHLLASSNLYTTAKHLPSFPFDYAHLVLNNVNRGQGHIGDLFLAPDYSSSIQQVLRANTASFAGRATQEQNALLIRHYDMLLQSRSRMWAYHLLGIAGYASVEKFWKSIYDLEADVKKDIASTRGRLAFQAAMIAVATLVTGFSAFSAHTKGFEDVAALAVVGGVFALIALLRLFWVNLAETWRARRARLDLYPAIERIKATINQYLPKNPPKAT